MNTPTQQQAKHTPIQVDECPDANGHWTLRPHDGTPNGNIDDQPIATAYTEANAQRLAHCWNNHDALLEALRAVDEMFSNPVGINKNSVRDQVRAAIQAATINQ